MASTWDFLGFAIEADWVEAWATVAGAVSTAGTLIYAAAGLAQERKTRRTDMARIEKERQATQDLQARTVVVHDRSICSPDDPRNPYLVAKVGNYGTSAVTGLACVLMYVDGGRRHTAGEILTFPVLKPGDVKHLTWPLSGAIALKWISGSHIEYESLRFDVEATFSDSQGARWTTDSDGITSPSSTYRQDKELRLEMAEKIRKENLAKLPDTSEIFRPES